MTAFMPHVRNASALAQLARAEGWTVHLTYLSEDKGEHRHYALTVWFSRGDSMGCARWRCVDDSPWRYDVAVLGGRLLNLAQTHAAVIA